VGRWLEGGEALDARGAPEARHPWYRVLWLSGVDYFSTLAYQPGIALIAAGALSPIATLLLVLVTLFGALPVYSQVAWRSYAGQGSIAMLERLLHAWWAKGAVLVLLGFAATDFVITITLSSADAAKHAVENPLLEPFLHGAQVPLTFALLGVLAVVFLRGFREAIGLASLVAVPYMGLTALVIARCGLEVMRHPELLDRWREAVSLRGDPAALVIASALVFPRLALGLSGFETGVAVMPLVSGQGTGPDGRPVGRIANTRRLLLSAAVLMSVFLLVSSLATTLLVPEPAYRAGGAAAGRALAWLAHGLLGHAFGTAYDLATIVMLWFAGASAMAGLLNLIPRYLPRYGMAPRWAAHARPLVIAILAVACLVTQVFHANVEAQAGAYATGVLVLMLSAAVAVTLAYASEAREGTAVWRRKALVSAVYFGLVSVVFAFTLADNVAVRPDGVVIAAGFIAGILALGAVSRYRRSTELRVNRLTLVDDESAALWEDMRRERVNLVPMRNSDPEHRRQKAAEIRRYYRADGPIAFIHVYLADNRSEFLASLRAHVRREGDEYVIDVGGAVAIANTIAYASELLDPRALFLGLTRRNLMSQAVRYLLWGEGETGLLVYSILVRYWDWTPEEDVRPLIFLMSE
jgi:hypothetical protein